MEFRRVRFRSTTCSMAATNSTARRPCVTKTRPIIDYLLPRSRAAAGLPPCRPAARPCLYAPQLEKTLFFSISRRADPQYDPIVCGPLSTRPPHYYSILDSEKHRKEKAV